MEYNIYYHPENEGCEPFFNIECGASYEYDTFLVTKRKKDGALAWATDSGCSCPTPFEGVKFAEMTLITDLDEFKRQLEGWANDSGRHEENRQLDEEVFNCIKKVGEHLTTPRS